MLTILEYVLLLASYITFNQFIRPIQKGICIRTTTSKYIRLPMGRTRGTHSGRTSLANKAVREQGNGRTRAYATSRTGLYLRDRAVGLVAFRAAGRQIGTSQQTGKKPKTIELVNEGTDRPPIRLPQTMVRTDHTSV